MKKNYSHDQMLSIWRLRLGLEAPENEASIERFDALDIERSICMAMRQWYLNLLDTAELRHLSPQNIAPNLRWHYDPRGNYLYATLPDDVRRLVEIRPDALSRPMILSTNPDDFDAIIDPLPLRRPFCSPMGYCSAGQVADSSSNAPAATALSFSGTIIVPGNTPPAFVMAVTDPGEESYLLDESALSLIPCNLPDNFTLYA